MTDPQEDAVNSFEVDDVIVNSNVIVNHDVWNWYLCGDLSWDNLEDMFQCTENFLTSSSQLSLDGPAFESHEVVQEMIEIDEIEPLALCASNVYDLNICSIERVSDIPIPPPMPLSPIPLTPKSPISSNTTQASPLCQLSDSTSPPICTPVHMPSQVSFSPLPLREVNQLATRKSTRAKTPTYKFVDNDEISPMFSRFMVRVNGNEDQRISKANRSIRRTKRTPEGDPLVLMPDVNGLYVKPPFTIPLLIWYCIESSCSKQMTVSHMYPLIRYFN